MPCLRRAYRALVGLTLLSALPAGALPAQDQAAIGAFWTWFRSHDASLLGVKDADEAVCDTLYLLLQAIDTSLTFELGPRGTEPREFIVSADGLRGAFPAVRATTAGAPPLPHWVILPFRRPHPGFTSIRYGGLSVNASAVTFRAEPDGERTGLTLVVPGYAATPDRRWEAATYLLLDGLIGEYAMETRVGFITIRATRDTPAGVWRPLTALSTVIDTTVP